MNSTRAILRRSPCTCQEAHPDVSFDIPLNIVSHDIRASIRSIANGSSDKSINVKAGKIWELTLCRDTVWSDERPRRRRSANRSSVSTMVPSYPSRARPCPARSCRADNCRRVVDDASRALILYDAATQRTEINLLPCMRVSSFRAVDRIGTERVRRYISGSRPGSRKRSRPTVRTWMCEEKHFALSAPSFTCGLRLRLRDVQVSLKRG